MFLIRVYRFFREFLYLLNFFVGCTNTETTYIFRDADVIVFLGGNPRKPGMERMDWL